MNFKRYSILVCLILAILVCSSVSVFADTTTYDISANGDNSVVATFDDATGTLTISGSGATKDYKSTSSNHTPLVDVLNSVQSIVIEEGVTSIGNYLFYYSGGVNALFNVSSITFPSTLTSIGDNAFSQLGKNTEIAELRIPGNVKTIGENAFSNSGNITSLIIEEGCTSIGEKAFNSTVSSFTFLEDTMPAALAFSFKAGDGATATISSKNVYLKEYLEYKGFSVTTIGDDATEADKWASYPDEYTFELGSPTATDVMGYYNPFTHVFELIGSGATKDYTGNNGSYLGYSIIASIREIIVHEGITTIGRQLFYAPSTTSTSYVKSLAEIEEISLPSTLTSIGEKSFYGMEYASTAEKSIDIPAKVETIEDYAFYTSNIEKVNFGAASVLTNIGERAFNDCSSLIEIELPDGLKTIGASAFRSCDLLPSIEIPASVESIETYAFYDNENLTTIYNYSEKNQTIGTKAFTNIGDSPTVYMYSANTAMETAVANENAEIIYLDGSSIILSGTLDNGVTWEYDPATQTLSFSGNGDIPDFTDGSQPWYGAASQYGGVGTYGFGSGITGIGTGVFGSYGSSYGGDGSGSAIYGPAGLDYAGAGGGGATYSGTASGDSSDTDNDADTESDKEQEAMIIVDAEPTNFLVTVPIMIEVSMDRQGNIDCGDDYYVYNECAMGPIIITDIKVVAALEWSLESWDTDFKNMSVSSKKIALTINGVEVGSDGSVIMNDSLSSVIRHQEKKELTFDAQLAAQRKAIKENVAAIVFTVDFDKV